MCCHPIAARPGVTWGEVSTTWPAAVLATWGDVITTWRNAIAEWGDVTQEVCGVWGSRRHHAGVIGRWREADPRPAAGGRGVPGGQGGPVPGEAHQTHGIAHLLLEQAQTSKSPAALSSSWLHSALLSHQGTSPGFLLSLTTKLNSTLTLFNNQHPSNPAPCSVQGWYLLTTPCFTPIRDMFDFTVDLNHFLFCN